MKPIAASSSAAEKLILTLVIAICAIFHACKNTKAGPGLESARESIVDITSSHKMANLP